MGLLLCDMIVKSSQKVRCECLPTGMYWLMTTRLGGELQQPMTGSTLGWEKILSLGYSSLKSRDILGVHSRSARIFAAISFPCHLPRQVSPLGLELFST